MNTEPVPPFSTPPPNESDRRGAMKLAAGMVGFATGALGLLAVVATAAVVSLVAARAEVRAMPDEVNDACDTDALDAPIQGGLQYKITCPSVDAGTAVARLDSPDGGPLSLDTLYVAPAAGSSVNVRVGFGSVADVTSTTGIEVGATGRDGVGTSLDVKGGAKPECKSEGAAQSVDVVAGAH